MNFKIVATALALLIGGIFSIATSSIAIECYNKPGNEAFKTEKNSNFTFIVVNLVFAILLTLVGLLCVYAGFSSPY